MNSRLPRILVPALALIAIVTTTAASGRGQRSPDLLVSSLTPPASLHGGAAMKAKVKNGSIDKAGKSTTLFLLSTDRTRSHGDAIVGRAHTKALRAHRHATA